MTLVTAQFIKEYLPTPEEQLKLFKEILDCGNRERGNIYNFNFIPHVDRDSIYVYKIGSLTSLEDNINRYDDAKTYVEKTVEKMLVCIAIFIFNQCKERNTNTVYILEPEALLERTYIEVSGIADKVELRCVVGICFDYHLVNSLRIDNKSYA